MSDQETQGRIIPSPTGRGGGCVDPRCPLRASCKVGDVCTICSMRATEAAVEELSEEVVKCGDSDSNLVRMDDLIGSYKPIACP